jgi:hypothetical protein
MKTRKIQSSKRYILAFIIGTAVFILGFAITQSVAYLEYQRISNMQTMLSYDIFQDKLKYSLFNEDICSHESYTEISENLAFQGRIIDDLENKLGKDNEDVLFRKRFYSLVEAEHFEFINQVNEKCSTKINTILFFYSNLPDDLDNSEQTGRLLTTVANSNQNLIIYSFDINLNSKIVELLKQEYNIKNSPTIIINSQHKIKNPSNSAQIEEFLN